MNENQQAVLLKHLETLEIPADIGISIGCYQGGRLAFSWCQGIADREQSEAVTVDTNFRLASVTKQFTAAAVLLLEQDGLLSLADPIKRFFPEAPAYTDQITIQHLLQHTSGLPDYEDLYAKDVLRQLRDQDVEKLVFKQTAGYFAAGDEFRYSNSGYALLARVVALITDLSFPRFLEERIFSPLGMSGTLAYVNAPKKPVPTNRAIGYRRGEDGELAWADQNQTTAVLGDGGIYCNLKDYGAWLAGLYKGRILKPDTLQRAWTPGRLNNGDQIPYGYGWRLEETSSGWIPYHPGSTSGFSNCVRLLPNEEAVLLLSNVSGLDAKGITAELARILVPST